MKATKTKTPARAPRMDDILRKMLATPPNPTIAPPKLPKKDAPSRTRRAAK